MDIDCENDFNICRLCFTKEDNLIDIYGERGITLEISSILSKHFVFLAIEPKSQFNSDGKICESCWTKTFDFHSFHTLIYNLQHNWTNDLKPGHTHNIINDYSSTASTSLIKTEFPDVDVLLTEKLEIFDQHNSYHENNSYDMLGIEKDDKSFIQKSSSKKKKSKSVKEKRNRYDDYDDNEDDWQMGDQHDDDYVDDGIEHEIKYRPKKQTTTKVTKNPSSTSRPGITKEALTFFDDAIIDAYMKDHPFLCEICYVPLPTFAAAKTHHRSYHRQKGYIVCCGTKYFRRDRAIDHFSRHDGSSSTDQYTCDICQKTYARREYIKRHMESHIPSEEKSFKCATCDSSFVSQNKLNKHNAMRHYTEDDKMHTCPECGKKFLSVSYLNAHVRGVHAHANAQICDFCGKIIKSKQAMTQHRLYAHTDNPKVQCVECGSWLKNGDSLRMHMARHRSKPIECPTCQKVLPNKHSFNNHMIYTHGNRTYACHVCGKEYKKRFRLKEHVAQHHTGQALYTCTKCNMGFQTNNMYHTHRKKFHYEDWANDRRQRGILV